MTGIDVKDMEIQRLEQELEAMTAKLRLTQQANIELLAKIKLYRRQLREACEANIQLQAESVKEIFTYQSACDLLFSTAKVATSTIRGLRKQLADQIHRKRVGHQVCRKIISGLTDRNKELCDGMSALQKQIVAALAEKHEAEG